MPFDGGGTKPARRSLLTFLRNWLMPLEVVPAATVIPPEITVLDQMSTALASRHRWAKEKLWSPPVGDATTSVMDGKHCILGVMNIIDHGHAENHNYRWGNFKTGAVQKTFDRMTQIASLRLNWPDLGDDMVVARYNDASSTSHSDILSLIAETRRSFTGLFKVMS